MKVAVLGSNSFTAGHFVHYLLQETGAQVLGLSRSPESDPLFVPYLYRRERQLRFEFRQVDMRCEPDRLFGLLDEFGPEIVVNFAAQGEVRNSWKWPAQWYETNCLAVVRLAEHLRKTSYLQRYVAVSTPEVYGATGPSLKECHTYCPSTPYAASKLAGDLHLIAMQKRYGFPVVFTRSVNLYGIHQQLYRIIPRTIIYLRLGRTLDLHGRGKARRSFIHARDVADLTFRAVTCGRNGEVYHCAPDEEPRSIASIVRYICEQTGNDFAAATRMTSENFGQDACYNLDATKAKIELGWSARVSFEEGVRETIDWITENWDAILDHPLDYVHRE